MGQYLLKRTLLMLPTLFLITVLSYGMMRLAPGDPAAVGGGNLLNAEGGGENSSAGMLKARESEARKAFREHFNLDKPWYVGYALWLKGLVVDGSFGKSINIARNREVWELLRERLPVTIRLNLWAIAVVYLLAIPAGILAAVRQNTLLDRGMSLVFFLLYSLPSFWTGLLLIIGVSLWTKGAWPVSGLSSRLPAESSYWAILLDTARYYALPVLCLSYGSLAGLSRYARSGLLEVIRQDYVRTARAKGLPERVVILKHAWRNSLIPLVTLFAGLLPGLIGGSVIIEYLFDIPGMGMLGLEALGVRDYPVLMTIFGLSSGLTLVGILLADVLYVVVDPRISFDRGSR